MFLPFMFQASARAQRTSVEEARHDTWLRRRIGFTCGVLGVALIVGALAAGFSSLSVARFPDRPDQLPLAVAIVIAHAAITIVGVFAGYAMLSLAERLVVPSFEPRAERRVALTPRPTASSAAPVSQRYPRPDVTESMRVLS
jgi:hypothetical protein